MISLQGVVFGGGLGVAIIAVVMANAAFRRHRAFVLRTKPFGLGASRFNHISQGELS